LQLPERDRESDFGLALQQDATRRADQLVIADRFELKPSKISWLPLAIIPVLAIMLMLVEPMQPTSAGSSNQVNPIEAKQVKTVAKQLKKRIEQQKRKADSQGLTEAKEMYEKMESDLDKLVNKKSMNRKDAMIAINDLKKQLDDRRKELGSSEQMRKALSQMKGLQSGPGEKVAKAIEKGEFGKAEDLVKSLAQKMKDGKLTDQEKKQLQNQIKQMADALKKSAKDHEQKKQELKEQIEKAKQQGRGADAAKMQQQLNQLQQKDSQMQKMGQMAQAMQQASDAMKSGDAQAAADAMDKMSDQLGEMSQEMSELEDLESALGDLSQSKNQMRCQGCQGGGCKQCQGGGFGDSDSNQPGDGLGRGAGKGDRPESAGDTNTYETQVRGNVKKGKAIIAGFADGPNRKGVTREDIKAAIQSQISEDSDPSENQTLPRTEREHAQQYFDRLREGS
jgi:chemotaxis protein histidine kinase CheA